MLVLPKMSGMKTLLEIPTMCLFRCQSVGVIVSYLVNWKALASLRPFLSTIIKEKISPKVRALRGAAKLNGSQDYKDMLADALAERYAALG